MERRRIPRRRMQTAVFYIMLVLSVTGMALLILTIPVKNRREKGGAALVLHKLTFIRIYHFHREKAARVDTYTCGSANKEILLGRGEE